MTGFCGKCWRTLSDVMVDGRGYCEEHGTVYAEWNRPVAQAVVLDAHGTIVQVGDDVESGRYSATVVRVTAPSDERGPVLHVLFADGEIDTFVASRDPRDPDGAYWITGDVEVVR